MTLILDAVTQTPFTESLYSHLRSYRDCLLTAHISSLLQKITTRSWDMTHLEEVRKLNVPLTYTPVVLLYSQWQIELESNSPSPLPLGRTKSVIWFMFQSFPMGHSRLLNNMFAWLPLDPSYILIPLKVFPKTIPLINYLNRNSSLRSQLSLKRNTIRWFRKVM